MFTLRHAPGNQDCEVTEVTYKDEQVNGENFARDLGCELSGHFDILYDQNDAFGGKTDAIWI
jgi:hypothetical protein